MKIMTPEGFEIHEAYLIDYYTDVPVETSLWYTRYEKVRSVRYTMSHIRRHLKSPQHFPGDWGKYWNGPEYSTILSTSDFEITHVEKDFGTDRRETPLMMFLADWEHDEIYLASKNATLLITASYNGLDMILMYPMTEIYTPFKTKKYCKQVGVQDDMKYPFVTVLLSYDNEKHEIIDPLHRDMPKNRRPVSLSLIDRDPLTDQIS